jgi:hypothetical protein
VTAPAETMTEAVVAVMSWEDAAICVTATMIGSPVAYSPSATCSRLPVMPERVVVHASRRNTGRPRTRRTTAMKPSSSGHCAATAATSTAMPLVTKNTGMSRLNPTISILCAISSA